MDWQDNVRLRIKSKRQILFNKDDDIIQEVALAINNTSRKAVVLWALALAGETVRLLEQKSPQVGRARLAVELTAEWAAGNVKMPVAKKAILDCHAVAKQITDAEDIAHYHAIGQACATVHANGHAIGYPIYDLTAVVRKYGIDNGKKYVEQRKDHYIDRIIYWSENYSHYNGSWAKFIK
ncbi:MAG: putative immunity protein [Acutalibacteraceae bacterium]